MPRSFLLDDFIEILSAHRKPGQGHSQVILELLDKKKQLEAQLADCNKRIEQMFVPRAVADNIFSLLDVSSTVYYARQESRWDKIKETGPYLKIAMAVFKLQMAARWL